MKNEALLKKLTQHAEKIKSDRLKRLSVMHMRLKEKSRSNKNPVLAGKKQYQQLASTLAGLANDNNHFPEELQEHIYEAILAFSDGQFKSLEQALFGKSNGGPSGGRGSAVFLKFWLASMTRDFKVFPPLRVLMRSRKSCILSLEGLKGQSGRLVTNPKN